MQPGRNDPCPCGSGKKYKKCCGASANPTSARSSGDLAATARHAYASGDHRRALSLALGALKSNPNDPAAAQIGGVAYLSLGDWDKAQGLLEKAIKLAPNDPHLYSNLAVVLQHLGRFEDAERRCRQALALDPQLADAHNNLARALASSGRSDEAIAAYRHAIAIDPNSALFQFNLGALLQPIDGQLQAAEDCYLRALALDPGLAPALANLGALYLRQRRRQQAKDCLLKAHQADRTNAEVMNSLGVALLQLRDYRAASEWFRRAIDSGKYLPAYANLGTALEKSGDLRGAVEAYRIALANDTKSQLGYKNLLNALLLRGDLDEAYALVAKVVSQLDRVVPALLPHLANAFQQMGDFERRAEVWPLLRAALENGQLSDEDLFMSLLLLNYDDSISEDDVFRFHVSWGKRAASAAGRPATAPAATPQPEQKKIRLGYLSPDLGHHPVGYFIRNVIAAHDKSRFEIVCYANRRQADQLTDEIRRNSDKFDFVIDLDDEELADRIRGDGIDILIDLAGHTRDGRLQVMAWRPAPLQISYLGYPNSTGAEFVDYWITDAHAHSDDDTLHTERLLRLPESYLCFGGFEERPISSVPPAVRNGYVTFGSFNNLAKLSRTTIRLWAETLERVPNSKLLIKARWADSRCFRDNLLAELRKYGLREERVTLVGPVAGTAGHLDCYNQVDIALDSVPYNGTTTTCEALWMGVPVVTLVGSRHRQRTSFSILKNIGVEDTITWSAQEYVGVAANLAGDLTKLSQLRQKVAQFVRTSILCDPPRFTRQLEAQLLRVVGMG